MILDILIFLLIAAIVVVYFLYRSNPAKAKPLIFSLTAILAIFTVIWFIRWIVSPPSNNREGLPVFSLHKTTGCGLALATNQVVPDGGPIVILVLNSQLTRQTEQFNQDHLEGFKDSVSNNITIASIEQTPASYTSVEGLLPSDILAAVIQKNPSAKAIVSFVGAPSNVDSIPALQSPSAPKLVVYADKPRSLIPLVRGGQIAAMIVSKENIVPSSSGNRPLKELFNEFYLILTPQNITQHPQFR